MVRERQRHKRKSLSVLSDNYSNFITSTHLSTHPQTARPPRPNVKEKDHPQDDRRWQSVFLHCALSSVDFRKAVCGGVVPVGDGDKAVKSRVQLLTSQTKN